MTKDGRFKVSFDVVTDPLPPIDENLVCLALPREWFPLIQGWLSFIRAGFAYEGDDADANRDKGAKFLELFEGCDMLTDIRIVDNQLQGQYCGSSTWVLIGRINTTPSRLIGNVIEWDFDGDGVYETNQFLDFSKHIYGAGLPVADANDRLCRASWILARTMLDDWGDLLRLVRGLTNAIIKGTQLIVAWIAGHSGPSTQVGVGATSVSETVLDFLGQNIDQPETLRFLAEMIFCALQSSYPDDLDNFWDYIDWGSYTPETSWNSVNTVLDWTNLDLIMGAVYNTFQGRNGAYIALGYAYITSKLGLENAGFFTPTRQLMNSAIATAEYFDARDCVSFDCLGWEHQLTFDSGEADYIFIYGTPTSPGTFTSAQQEATWIDDGWYRQNAEFRLLPFEGGDYAITAIEIAITYGWTIDECYMLDYWGGPILDEDNENRDGNQLRTLHPPEGIQGFWLIVATPALEDATPPAFTMQVKLYGTGTNPFEAP